jgi:hypothetical protein
MYWHELTGKNHVQAEPDGQIQHHAATAAGRRITPWSTVHCRAIFQWFAAVSGSSGDERLFGSWTADSRYPILVMQGNVDVMNEGFSGLSLLFSGGRR